jgi:hypothetical protein
MNEFERFAGFSFGLHRQTAAVTAGHEVGELVAQRGAGHGTKASGFRIATFVDVEVDWQPSFSREDEKSVELFVEVWAHDGHPSEGGRSKLGRDVRKNFTVRRGVLFDAAKTDQLQLDPVCPSVAKLRQRFEARARFASPCVDMCPDGGDSVGPGGAHCELSPNGHFLLIPIRLVRVQRLERVGEGVAWVGRAIPRVRLVEVHMGVAKTRKNNVSFEIFAPRGLFFSGDDLQNPLGADFKVT